jgi:chromate reductase, NAD(P)H dehydrogenase (quinone)
MPALKVLALPGSARSGSFNRRLHALIVRRLEAMGVEVDAFDLRPDTMPIYDGDLEGAQGLPSGAKDLKARVQAADAVVFTAPEYNSSVTPLLKNAIDWASRTDKETGLGNVWERKVIALSSASPGAFGGLRGLYTLRQVFQHLEGLVLSEQVSVGRAHEAFDDEGNLKDERTAGFLDSMLERLIEVATAMRDAGRTA